jgi:hypothetical protein
MIGPVPKLYPVEADSCCDCDCHIRVSMGNSIYWHYCRHKKVKGDGYIGTDDRTPDWCPERKNKPGGGK